MFGFQRNSAIAHDIARNLAVLVPSLVKGRGCHYSLLWCSFFNSRQSNESPASVYGETHTADFKGPCRRPMLYALDTY